MSHLPQPAWRCTRRALLGPCLVLFAAVLGHVAPAAAGDAPPAGPELAPQLIDGELELVLAREGVAPAPLCDDATFLRRATLDLCGTIPRPAEVEAFLTDRSPDKRARRIQTLLESSDCAEHLAAQAVDLLLARFDAVGPERYYRESLQGWLAGELAAGRPYDELVAELLAAEGVSSRDPAVIYALDRGGADPADLAGASARIFLGLRLDCARCHDHPFSSAKQEDFHGLAAYFARLRIRGVPGRQGVFRVSEAPVGEHRVTLEGASERATVAPGLPLGAPATSQRPGAAPGQATQTSRRAELARWVTSPDNPWFARATVNRVWARLFGRGLVDPPDDLLEAEGATHAPLLDALGRAFAASGFSLRRLYASILGSRSYQRTCVGDPAAHALFAGARARPLDARSATRALLRATDRDLPGAGEPPRLHGALVRRLEQSLARTLPAQPDGVAPSAEDVTTAEALYLLAGRAPNGLVRGTIKRLLAAEKRPGARIEDLFLRTLSRRPTAGEARAARRAVRTDDAPAYEDLLWALLATSEFASNH